MAARQILVSGVVQGVGYRAWAVRTARELGVTGWVRNLHDGRVELWAEGTEAVLDALVERCRRGPRYAEVTGVEAMPIAAKGWDRFDAAPTADDAEH